MPIYSDISFARAGFEVPLINLSLLVSWLILSFSELVAVIDVVTVAASKFGSTDANAVSSTIQTY